METQTYSFELDYDKVDFTVDTILKHLKKWQENLWGEKVSYIVTEEVMGILGLFKVSTKRLKILINWWRHAKILCNLFWIKFNPNKYKYQHDLFQLDLL